MIGYRFSEFVPSEGSKSTFQKMLDIFLQLMLHTNGDVSEALNWMTQVDRKYQLSSDTYGMGDFVDDLRKEGYIKEDENGEVRLGGKSEQTIRKNSLEEIFGKLKRTRQGGHRSPLSGLGDEPNADRRPFQFGDAIENIAMTDSLRNAQINHGPGTFRLTEDDLEIVEQDYKSQCSTVLMIDISHSMILYGEDRITPAKKTALALAELITTRYPKDTLDIIVFGNDAWQIEIKDLSSLQVGPYHTNTVAGLELAMDLLRRRKNANRQIFMITDGKPTCLKEGGRYYKNSWGLDRKIISKTLTLAAQARRLKIPVTTFMIAKDPYLQEFVREFSEVNNGRAFYSNLKGLGEFVFEDYQRNRRKKVR
jgi:Ca-activated chloride channel family protein